VSDYIIRPAEPEDAPALHQSLELVAKEPGIGAEPGEWSLELVMQMIDKHASGAGLLLVALSGAQVLGAALLSRLPAPPAAHVLDFAIFAVPAVRGTGLASNLAEKALQWAWEHGYRKVIVNPFASNGRAISFYKKLGFVQEGLRRAQYMFKQGLEDEVLMGLMGG
jgi:RimJ/RimL family protein N-acetyltransferase